MSKTVYLAGETRQAGAVRLPVDRERSAYVRFIPEDEAPVTGLPTWIREACVQQFTPSEDVNTAIGFTLTGMSDAPEMIIIGCSKTMPTAMRDFGGCVISLEPFGLTTSGSWLGYQLVRQGNSYYAGSVLSSDAVTDCTKNGFTFQTANYAGTRCYWRAGVTYTIIALRVKMPS